MKRIYTLFFSLALFLNVSAQINGDGFYRVQNDGTKYYAVLVDCSGGWINNTTPNMSSLELYSADKHDIASEAGSVIYVKNLGGTNYDLVGQGTSLQSFIGSSIVISITGNASTNKYKVVGKKGGLEMTLYAQTTDNFGYSAVNTSGNAANMWWKALPVKTDGDNYLGIKPTIKSGNKYYQPFYFGFPFKLASAGMKAYYVSQVDGDAAALKEFTNADGIIPAETPVIIECSSDKTTDNRVEILYNVGNKVTDNKLSGNYFCCDFISIAQFGGLSSTAMVPFDSNTMRVFNVDADGRLCLSTNTENLHDWYFVNDVDESEPEEVWKAAHKFLNKNSSYLSVPAGTPEVLKLMSEEEFTHYVGIEDVECDNNVSEVYYSVDGKRLASPMKGINIVKKSDGKTAKVVY